MKHFKSLPLLAFGLLIQVQLPAQPTTPAVTSLADCNIVWEGPSQQGSFDSLPLGNGDIGINVWFETNGDILFYLPKVKFYDSEHLLPKLGRVWLRTEPALDVSHVKTTLLLEQAAVEILAGDTTPARIHRGHARRRAGLRQAEGVSGLTGRPRLGAAFLHVAEHAAPPVLVDAHPWRLRYHHPRHAVCAQRARYRQGALPETLRRGWHGDLRGQLVSHCRRSL